MKAILAWAWSVIFEALRYPKGALVYIRAH